MNNANERYNGEQGDSATDAEADDQVPLVMLLAVGRICRRYNALKCVIVVYE